MAPLLRQLLRPDRQQHRDHGWETGRDGGDGEGDPRQEQRVEVLAAGEAEDDDQRQGCRRHDRDDHGELIELLGERRLLLLDPAQHPGDVPDLARHPGGRDHHLAPAPRDLRVHVRHVDPVTEWHVLAGDRVEALGHGCALAGESGLFDLQRRRHQDPSVGRHLVAGLEADDVPGNQLFGRDLDALAVTADARRHDQHLPQRGDALGGLALLVQTHHGVDHRQAEDHQPGRDVLQGDDADDRRPDQHQLHQVAVLAEEGPPARLLGLLGQLVRTVPLPTLDNLGRAQTDRRIDVQPATDIVGGESRTNPARRRA